jgi:exopolysaccharide production protein ExoQ
MWPATSTQRLTGSVAAGSNPSYLSWRVWASIVVLYGILAVLEPYDLLSPISGYGLQEHRAEIGSALDTIQGGSMLRRLGVLVLCLYGAVAVFVSRRTHRRFTPAIAVPGTALFLLALASPLWAEDPAITTRKAIVLFSLVLTAFGLARCWDFDTIVRVALVLSGATILLGVVTETVLGTMRPWDPDFRFRGSIHPNSMSLYCTIFVISSVVLARRFTGGRSALMVLMSALGMVLLLLTKSRGSLIGLCAALVVMFLLSVRRHMLVLSAGVVAVAICGAIVFIPDLSAHAHSWASLGRSTDFDLTSMTGRTELFRDLLPYVGDRPFLGYGYDSFWQPVHILEVARSQGWIAGSAHNQVIGMLLDLGAVGGTLFLILLGSSLWMSIWYARRDGSALSLFPVAMLVWSYVNMVTFGFWFETTVPSLLALLVVARLAIRDAPGPGVRYGGRVLRAAE